MDITSVEFYTLAFVVAMALVALLIGKKEKQPPSTYIVQLTTTEPADQGTDIDTVILQPSGDAVLLKRTGIEVSPEDSVNLVITIQQDYCTIVEKRGRKSKGRARQTMDGEAVLKCLRPYRKYRIRYESQLNSTWAKFTLDTSSSTPCAQRLNF